MSKKRKNPVGVKRKGNWRPLERPEPREYFVSELPRLQPVDFKWAVNFFDFQFTEETLRSLKWLLRSAKRRKASIEDFYQWSLVNASKSRTPNTLGLMRAYSRSLTESRHVIPVLTRDQMSA